MAKAVPYLRLVVAFDALVYAFHTYLDIRQLKVYALARSLHGALGGLDANL